jgi:hypothetical protein
MFRHLAIVVGWLFGVAAAATSAPLLAQEMHMQMAALATSVYTRHAAREVQAEIVVLRVDKDFNADQQQKIVNAAVAWNYVLNGYIRFEIDPVPFGAVETEAHEATEKDTDWIVSVYDPGRRKPGSRIEELGITMVMPTGGGIVDVNIRILNKFNLENVILHELGHVLGLGHDRRSRLMSMDYVFDHQGCVDKYTVETLATLKHLPVNELNWCVLPAHEF